MKALSGISLGVLTAIGGFVDVGNIATAGQAGSKFGFSLIWAIMLGTIAVIFLIEMVGRMSAIGDKAYADILREKFGVKFAPLPLSADLVADVLLLAAEIGGAAFALYLLSDIPFRLWVPLVAFVSGLSSGWGRWTSSRTGPACSGWRPSRLSSPLPRRGRPGEREPADRDHRHGVRGAGHDSDPVVAEVMKKRRRMQIDLLVGRRVQDVEGRRVGRVDEVRLVSCGSRYEVEGLLIELERRCLAFRSGPAGAATGGVAEHPRPDRAGAHRLLGADRVDRAGRIELNVPRADIRALER